VVHSEVELLRRAGHEVMEFTRYNGAIPHYSFLRKALLFTSTTWDGRAYAELRSLIHRERPDIAHCHNFLPLISPAAYHACRDSGVPVVQTLHNYRLLCPAGTLFRDQKTCLHCLHGLGAGAMRGCYRGSRSQSSAVAMMLAVHRLCGTWRTMVDAYIAVSQFARNVFVAASALPADKIHVKPNFLARDPGRRTGSGDYALFVGRLSPEKGALELLTGWRRLRHIPLRIVGSGPAHAEAVAVATRPGYEHVTLTGQLSPAQTLAEIRRARFVVFPSRWYEPFGMALVEAAACGVPAIASRIGGIPELVREGITGLLFKSDDPDDLIAKASWAWQHPRELAEMGSAARSMYQELYSAEKNYKQLMQIYESVLHPSRKPFSISHRYAGNQVRPLTASAIADVSAYQND
jgi:glycosyltransferase involved in cell wall biosynthesis